MVAHARSIRRLGVLALATLAVLAPLAAAGCVPTSKKTIGDASKAAFDRDLQGIWRFDPKKDKPDEGPYYVAFAPRGEREVEACMLGTRGGKKGLDVSLYRGVTTRAGDRRFLCVEGVEAGEGARPEAEARDREYLLLCYEVSGEKVRIGVARLEPLAKAVEAGKLKGEVKRQPVMSVTLTDTEEALAAYFEKAPLEEHFNMELAATRVEAGPK